MPNDSCVPSDSEVERVRELGDEHPAQKLEERVLDDEYLDLDDKERQDLKDFCLVRFLVRVLEEIEDSDERVEAETVLKGEDVFRILSEAYDELHFAWEEGLTDDEYDPTSQLEEITFEMFKSLQEVMDRPLFELIFDHVFYAVHPAHSSSTRDKMFERISNDEDGFDISSLPDYM